MFILCRLPGVSARAGGNIGINLGGVKYHGMDALPVMLTRDRAGGVVLLRPDAELRRLLALRQELSQREARQLLGPAGQLPRRSRSLTVITTAATLPVFGRTDHRPGRNGRPHRLARPP